MPGTPAHEEGEGVQERARHREGHDCCEDGLHAEEVHLAVQELDEVHVEDAGDLVRRLALERVVVQELAEARPEELGAAREVDLPRFPAPLGDIEAGRVGDQRFPDQIEEVHGCMHGVGEEHAKFPKAVLHNVTVHVEARALQHEERIEEGNRVRRVWSFAGRGRGSGPRFSKIPHAEGA